MTWGNEKSEVIFTLIAERYERRSLGIASNLVISQWECIFANPMSTAAAIDRVVHHAVILEFDVPGYWTDAALRVSHGALAAAPEVGRIVIVWATIASSQPRLRNLAYLEPDPIVEDDDPVGSSECETQDLEERPPSPRQLALWKTVQEARVQCISPREIARQLGVSRNTVRKYARALAQPTNRRHNRGAQASAPIDLQTTVLTNSLSINPTESLDNDTVGTTKDSVLQA